VVTRTRHFDEQVHATAWPHRTTVEHSVLAVNRSDPADRLLALVARACQQGLTSEARLAEALASRPGQPHAALLRECLADVGAGQVVLGQNRRCDNLYADQHLVLEIDGRLGHEGWTGRVRDGVRDRAAARQGRLTVRGYWPDVAVAPCTFAEEVGFLLRMRGWRGAPRACRRRGCALRRARAA
jgi:hypothetical protein